MSSSNSVIFGKLSYLVTLHSNDHQVVTAQQPHHIKLPKNVRKIIAEEAKSFILDICEQISGTTRRKKEKSLIFLSK
jgi:hypothetical protein